LFWQFHGQQNVIYFVLLKIKKITQLTGGSKMTFQFNFKFKNEENMNDLVRKFSQKKD
jgi:hypothetical protein